MEERTRAEETKNIKTSITLRLWGNNLNRKDSHKYNECLLFKKVRYVNILH